MSAVTPNAGTPGCVQIVLVGGPLDGETHMIPEAEARSGISRRYAKPLEAYPCTYWDPRDGFIPAPPTHLEYQPMMVDFAGWPYPSIAEDGTRRYVFVGER